MRVSTVSTDPGYLSNAQDWHWWFVYLFVPALKVTYWFAVNFISDDAEIDEEWLSLWVKRATVITQHVVDVEDAE